MQIHINNFVRRQTPDSRFSHFGGTDAELLALIEAAFTNGAKGYREGVLVVPVPPQGFKTASVTLQPGDVLAGKYEARQAGEEPRKHTGIAVPPEEREARKTPAVRCDVILYASTVLAEDGDNELPAEDGNWEVISINAYPWAEDSPIPPGTLMANHFQLDGGTATGMSAEEFEAALRVSVLFWKDKGSLA